MSKIQIKGAFKEVAPGNFFGAYTELFGGKTLFESRLG